MVDEGHFLFRLVEDLDAGAVEVQEALVIAQVVELLEVIIPMIALLWTRFNNQYRNIT